MWFSKWKKSINLLLKNIFNNKKEFAMYNLQDPVIKGSNFYWYEFFNSMTAKRKGINNIPTDDSIYYNIIILVRDILQPLRDHFNIPIIITSGYRCPELNKEIGGSATSNHCFGYAVDIEPGDPSISLYEILEWIYNNCQYRELIAEYFPNGWVHVAKKADLNIRKLKLKDKIHNYDEITMDALKTLYKRK